jgi:hypothetical protein
MQTQQLPTKSIKLSALAAAVCAGVVVSSLSPPALASSHREAPNITRMPTVDSTDYYIFNSYEAGRGDFVTMIANYIPLQDAYGGPNYFPMDPAATYSLHVDTDGDAEEDITFAFNFSRMLANDNQGIKLMIGPEGDQKAVGVPLYNNARADFETYFSSLTIGY